MTPKYITAADLFGKCVADMERGDAPLRFKLAEPFAGLDVRPGRLLLFGGAPGSGKTAALVQMGIDLLRLNPSARLLVANVEMSPMLLVERIVSRLACVPLTRLAERTLGPDELKWVQAATKTLAPVAGRLAFLKAPYSLEHVGVARTAFNADVMMIDYVQRFTVGDQGKDKREQLETAATVLRGFCNAGAALFVASAVARQKGPNGSTYAGLGLASFRGSSELEFGCDSAYLVETHPAGRRIFKCEKNRFGAVANVMAQFDGTVQTFAPIVLPSGQETIDGAIPDRNKVKGG